MKCKMNSLVTSNAFKIFLWHIKEDRMGVACNAHGEIRNSFKILVGILEGNSSLGVWIGLIWPRLRDLWQLGRLLWTYLYGWRVLYWLTDEFYSFRRRTLLCEVSLVSLLRSFGLRDCFLPSELGQYSIFSWEWQMKRVYRPKSWEIRHGPIFWNLIANFRYFYQLQITLP